MLLSAFIKLAIFIVDCNFKLECNVIDIGLKKMGHYRIWTNIKSLIIG